MKRWVHSATDWRTANVTQAQKDLMNYSEEQVNFVRECQDAIVQELSDSFFDEDDRFAEENRTANISSIKNDYIEQALEDDLMTEEEFNDILDLLDIIDLGLGASVS